MYLTRSEYDRGVNTFSPEGRLFQVRMKQAISSPRLGSYRVVHWDPALVGIVERKGRFAVGFLTTMVFCFIRHSSLRCAFFMRRQKISKEGGVR
jgi:Proteasome subunit A N-terminal signature